MVDEGFVFQGVEDGNVELVGQKQVVDDEAEAAEVVVGQFCALQSDVHIRKGLVIAFGPRAVQYHTLNPLVCCEHFAQFLQFYVFQSVGHN